LKEYARTVFVRQSLRLAGHIQLLPALESGEETLIGGQAVMEGVMMRAPRSYCVAVRKPGGEVVTDTKELSKVSDRYPIFKLPVLRGLGTLGQAMSLGFKSLQFSANVAMEAEQEKAGGTAGKDGPKKEVFSNWVMGIQLAISLAFFIVAYKLVPLWITTKIGESVEQVRGNILFNLVDGVIRIAIFIGFMWALSQWKDIRQTFRYHGAEHRVVYNFESGQPVTVANAQRYSTFHPRCGTSFLITIMILSMLLYSLIPVSGFVAKFALRIGLLAPIVGLSYEVIRYAARQRGALFNLLAAPGLWLQRITTKDPADDQAEVAIIALNGAMELERSQGGQAVIA
jgi:uncharacterized protein YqhQ